MMLLHGLNLHVVECSKLLKQEKLKAQVASVLMPWESDRIWMALAIKADILMQHLSTLQEVRQKIMLSEGVNDDMQPVTLEEIFQSQEN
jgi:hypothetical protein